jgi:ribokinase
LRSAKVLILQNEIPEEINEDVARRARALGVKTILNAAPARAFETALPGYVDILVVNPLEAEMPGSAPVRSLADAEKATGSLASRFAAVVVTAGGDGVAFQNDIGEKVSLPGVAVKVQSTHEAGDMFVGTLGARLALGDDIRVALIFANQPAAKLVSTPENERGG